MVKATPQKAATGGKGKPVVQLTGKSLMLWFCLIFVVCGWMFVLGVLVGRGTAPVNFDIQAIQNELITLKQSMLKQESKLVESDLEKEYSRDTFEFYEALKGKEKNTAIQMPIEKKNAPTQKKAAAPATKPEPQNKETVRQVEADTGGTLAVQVASTKDMDAAERMVQGLRDRGYPAFSVKADIPEKGTWYRVRVGYFKDKAAAESTRRRLLQDRFEGIIVRK